MTNEEAKQESILMPLKLTAEEGHKALLIGEFFESIEILNDDAEEYVVQKIPVSWQTIKSIYDKIIEFEKNKKTILP